MAPSRRDGRRGAALDFSNSAPRPAGTTLGRGGSLHRPTRFQQDLPAHPLPTNTVFLAGRVLRRTARGGRVVLAPKVIPAIVTTGLGVAAYSVRKMFPVPDIVGTGLLCFS